MTSESVDIQKSALTYIKKTTDPDNDDSKTVITTTTGMTGNRKKKRDRRGTVSKSTESNQMTGSHDKTARMTSNFDATSVNRTTTPTSSTELQ